MRRAALALVVLCAACGDDELDGKLPAKPQSQLAAESAAKAAAERPVSYPESSDGLAGLINDLQQAVAADNARDEARLLASLRLPDATSWFQSTFGSDVGQRLSDEYAPLRAEIGQLIPVLSKLVQNGQSVLKIDEFRKPDQPSEAGYQSRALAAMIKPTALYSVRLATVDGKQVYHLWSFVYVGGTFRYVGKLKAIEPGAPPNGPDRLEHKLSEASAQVPPAPGK